jgi:hypothetical protein
MPPKKSNKSKRVVDSDGRSNEITADVISEINGLRGKGKSSPRENPMNDKAREALLKVPGCHCYKVVGTVYGTTGQPDLFACYKGQLYCLEGKVRNPLATPIAGVRPNQRSTLKRWCAAGARIGVYTTPEEAVSMLEAWDAFGKDHTFWLWYGAEGNRIWKHVDEIEMKQYAGGAM